VPRVRANDYDTKASTILDAAASLFARDGYPAVKMQDIAKACGATKSMLYHYYATKDELLAALLEEHLSQLLEVMEEAMGHEGTPDECMLAFVTAYTQRSTDSRSRHMVAMNDVKFLPPEVQVPLVDLQRRLTDVGATFLRKIQPDLPKKVYKPYAMLLLGMLNWIDVWFRAEGPIKPKELRERITQLFLHGFLSAKAG
jgi:AcrR family transcriptional regulator